MPLNILRLNQRHQHPTERIVFIKASPGPDSALAEEFLNRVAAICHPVLKNHTLSVTTLEDFPPNKEFLGRNFNNGECIQLVLKSQSGSWLSFRSVVMVMMHELAHNVQMNHGREFWKVRNQFAGEMQALWAKGYTGEGVWGPGREVETGIKVGGGREVETEMPEQLCGGTYRSRRRKRVRGPKLSSKEQRERRIAKKFGVNGQALGEDVVERSSLQGFKGPTTKSRVAGSKRGRELRAAAALARFDQAKSETVEPEPADDNEDEELESDEGYEDVDADYDDAKDIDGSKLKDGKGQGMIRVCGEEDTDDVQVKAEMDELNGLNDIPVHKPTDDERAEPENSQKVKKSTQKPAEGMQLPKLTTSSQSSHTPTSALNKPNHEAENSEAHLVEASDTAAPAGLAGDAQICSICSMSNQSAALLCGACSNVLSAAKCPGSWKCGSASCADGYLNPADFGVCGICGRRRG